MSWKDADTFGRYDALKLDGGQTSEFVPISEPEVRNLTIRNQEKQRAMVVVVLWPVDKSGPQRRAFWMSATTFGAYRAALGGPGLEGRGLLRVHREGVGMDDTVYTVELVRVLDDQEVKALATRLSA